MASRLTGTSGPGVSGGDPEADPKRRQILEACVAVVGDLGYRQAKVMDICKTAGVTLRDFYTCFDGKSGCFEACYVRIGQELVTLGCETFAAATGTLEERVRLTLEAVLGALADDGRAARFVAEAAVAGGTGEEQIVAMVADARRSVSTAPAADPDRPSLGQDVLVVAIAGAVTHTIITWVRSGRTDGLRDVAPYLAHFMALVLRPGGDGGSWGVGEALPTPGFPAQ